MTDQSTDNGSVFAHVLSLAKQIVAMLEPLAHKQESEGRPAELASVEQLAKDAGKSAQEPPPVAQPAPAPVPAEPVSYCGMCANDAIATAGATRTCQRCGYSWTHAGS